MSKLTDFRSEIDEIQKQFLPLILRRFSVAKQIAKMKAEENLDLEDLQRENQLVHQFDNKISDPLEKIAVQNILRAILNETKSVMKDAVNEKK